MAKEKAYHDLQNTMKKTKDQATQVLRKGKQFLLHMRRVTLVTNPVTSHE